jgi:hypothetical protein
MVSSLNQTIPVSSSVPAPVAEDSPLLEKAPGSVSNRVRVTETADYRIQVLPLYAQRSDKSGEHFFDSSID